MYLLFCFLKGNITRLLQGSPSISQFLFFIEHLCHSYWCEFPPTDIICLASINLAVKQHINQSLVTSFTTLFAKWHQQTPLMSPSLGREWLFRPKVWSKRCVCVFFIKSITFGIQLHVSTSVQTCMAVLWQRWGWWICWSSTNSPSAMPGPPTTGVLMIQSSFSGSSSMKDTHKPQIIIHDCTDVSVEWPYHNCTTVLILDVGTDLRWCLIFRRKV